MKRSMVRATILGKPYLTGYEPVHDAQNKVIGIYYFGYLVRGSLTLTRAADTGKINLK